MLKRHKVLAGIIATADMGLAAAIAAKGIQYCTAMMAEVGPIGLFTLCSGGALIGGEYYIKTRRNKDDKIGTAHLIGKGDIEDILGNDGLRLSKDIQLKEKYDFEGSVTFGPTGSYKTTSMFFPNLLSNDIKGSIIVTDPKGELWEKTSGFQEKVCGRRVLKFSPLEPIYSEKYNLLTNCKDDTEVKELASILLFNGALSIELLSGKKAGGVEWLQMAEPLLCAALLYARDLEYPYNNIEFAFNLITSLNTKQLGAVLSGSNNAGVIKQWNIFKSVGGADRTEGSIKITLCSNLSLFTDSKINAVSDDNTFNIQSFRNEPTILYVVYPENKSGYLAPFIAPFFSQTLNALINYYTDESLPIHLLFDEFGNIGMLSNMSINVATIRSRRISMNICLQSITQLYQVYGDKNAKAILNNLKTKLVLPSLSDEDTLNYMSNLCGNKEVTVCNTNVNKQSTTHSYSKVKNKLFENSELRCLESDQLVLVTSNKQPIITTQNRYYEDKGYTNNISDCSTNIQKNNILEFDYTQKINELKIKIELENEDSSDIKGDLFNE